MSPTNTADLVLHLDLDGMAPWVLDVRVPTAAVRRSATDPDADVVLRGRPVALALLFYGRVDPTDLAEHGLAAAGGRHPERLALLADMLEAP